MEEFVPFVEKVMSNETSDIVGLLISRLAGLPFVVLLGLTIVLRLGLSVMFPTSVTSTYEFDPIARNIVEGWNFILSSTELNNSLTESRLHLFTGA